MPPSGAGMAKFAESSAPGLLLEDGADLNVGPRDRGRCQALAAGQHAGRDMTVRTRSAGTRAAQTARGRRSVREVLPHVSVVGHGLPVLVPP